MEALTSKNTLNTRWGFCPRRSFYFWLSMPSYGGVVNYWTLLRGLSEFLSYYSGPIAFTRSLVSSINFDLLAFSLSGASRTTSWLHWVERHHAWWTCRASWRAMLDSKGRWVCLSSDLFSINKFNEEFTDGLAEHLTNEVLDILDICLRSSGLSWSSCLDPDFNFIIDCYVLNLCSFTHTHLDFNLIIEDVQSYYTHTI